MKNRNREKYTFANINFLGSCNLDCYFCLGKDLEREFCKYDFMGTHFTRFRNLDKFLDILKDYHIKQIYLTGQNTDPLLYYPLGEFIAYLQAKGFCVGIRTNGLMAEKRMDIINSCNTCYGDAVGYTVLTLNTIDQYAMTKRIYVPEWDKVFRLTEVPFRVSVVVTKINLPYLVELIHFVSAYRRINPNLKYCQIRKVSTDYRQETLKPDIDAFDKFSEIMKTHFSQKGKIYQSAEKYIINDIDVVLWRTTETSVNSMNYFTNGVISKEYFIIEGYEKALIR